MLSVKQATESMMVERRFVWPTIAAILAGTIVLATTLPTLLASLDNEIAPGGFATLEEAEAACGKGNTVRVEKITPTYSSDAGFTCDPFKISN
jgi:hypothetical protein